MEIASPTSAVPPGLGPIPDAAPRGPQPLHIGLDLQLDPATRAMHGTADITLRNTTAQPLDRLYLRLWANAGPLTAAGGSAAIRDVAVGGKAVQTQTDRTVVEVPLASPLAPGADTTLHYGFDVTVPDRQNRMGVTDDGHEALYGNAIPLLEVHDAGGWELHPYFDLGESFYTLQTDMDARITAPAGWTVVSSGHVTADTPDPTGATHTLTVSAPHVRDFLVATSDRFAEAHATVNGTMVHAYADDGNTGRARSMLATSVDALTHYDDRYGTYPYPDLSVVSAPHIGGGMEYPNAVLVDLDSIEDRFDQPSTIDHEIAHQWFYGLVGNDQFREPWLDESLATFAAHDLTGHYPALTGPSRPPKSRQLLGLPDVSAPVPDVGGSEAMYIGNVYLRGDHALRGLEDALGENAFFTGVRSYLAAHRDGIATTADFIASMSTAAGHDLTGWFAQHGIRADEPDASRTLDPNGPATG